MNFAPAPFWFLNHRLEKDEISRQLILLKESGVSGFFMHPRSGLLTPYGSREWFDMIEFIVSESKKLGLEAWLYDEDPYPSGAAGGMVCIQHPEYRAKRLMGRILTPDEFGYIREDFGGGNILSAAAVKLRDGRILDVINISEDIGLIREDYHKTGWSSTYYCDWINDVKNPHIRAEAFNPRVILESRIPAGYEAVVCYTEIYAADNKYGCLPDNLNRDCVKKFIELTHEKYKQRLESEFGRIIPGIFTDEPSMGGFLPWTDSLPREFKKSRGYDLNSNLFRLFTASDDESRRFREDYWRTVNELMESAYYAQISDWCKKNNLQLCGHLLGEEDPVCQTYAGGRIFPLIKYFDIPGFDIISCNLGNQERPGLMSGAKLVSSAARRQGKRRIMCEAFACNPFNFDTGGLMRMTNWLFALGINFIVPHGFHYSYDGNRKFDAGKSFFFQDKYFRDFPEYSEYCAKTGELLAECEQDVNTALICPEFSRYIPAEREKAAEIRGRYFEAVAALIGNQIEFDIIDGNTESGGYRNVIFIGDENAVPGGIAYPFDPDLLKQSALHTPIRGTNTANLIVNRMKRGGRALLFIFNNSPEPSRFEVAEDEALGVYNPVKGEYFSIPGEILLNGYECVILTGNGANPICGEYRNPPEIPYKSYESDTSPQWDYTPEGVAAAINFWDVKAGGREFGSVHFAPLREFMGAELSELINFEGRPVFDKAPRVKSNYPVNGEYTAEFTLDSLPEGEALLLLEGSTLRGDCRIFINGIEVKGFEPRFVYDVTNSAARITSTLKTGGNTISIRFENAGEFDGIYSSIYIIFNTG